MSAYNRCGEDATPKRVYFLDFIKFQTGRYSWDSNSFIGEVNQDKWGTPEGTTSGQATIFHVHRKYDNPTESEPIRGGEIVTFKICETQEPCKGNIWAGGKDTPDMKSGHPNTDRNYIMTKIAGYGYPDDKTLYYGDTINIYHDNGKGNTCSKGFCVGQVMCFADDESENTECTILDNNLVGMIEMIDIDIPNHPNEFRIFNVNGAIPCEEGPSEKCKAENCPISVCPSGSVGICASGKEANCDENTGTWTCPCDNDDECPSNRECDSSNRCILKEGSGCIGDDECENQGFKYCLNKRCVDCKSNDDCDENFTCSTSSGTCVQKTNTGTVILLVVLGLALLTGVYFVLRGILKRRREKQQQLNDSLFLDHHDNNTTAPNQIFRNAYSDLNQYIQHIYNNPNTNIYDNTVLFRRYPYQTAH